MDNDKKYVILIAEDSESQLLLVKDILLKSNPNYIILEASNGEEALDVANYEFPDLILLDCYMPVMDGLKALEELKKSPVTIDIPVIVFTAKGSIKDAFDLGAFDFIKKPIDYMELIARVDSALKIVESINKTKRQKLEIERHSKSISQQNKDILEDIRYAGLIQKAILPDKDKFDRSFTDYFIFNQPKSIVGGDFYWLYKKGDTIIIAVADCTGHGISGALMHMMGNVFLNEIVIANKVKEPDFILNELRCFIINSLRSTGGDYEMKDGMDITVCSINKKTREIHFSGANNSIYIIHNGKLNEYKGDRMPVGIHVLDNEPFTFCKIKLSKNDSIYMFTDGYADQFGGERGKKFMYQRFKELLIKNSYNDMDTQHKELVTAIKNWKGRLEQVDDILVVGFKV